MGSKARCLRKRRAAISLGLVLLAFPLLLTPRAALQQSLLVPAVFELEIPEFGVTPTSKPELVIPTPNVDTLVLHILRPQADQIDYGQIGTRLNGQSVGLLTEINAGARGKIVRINLRRHPGYGLKAGRNTVEILANNQRGRTFYASFVLRTATENHNEDFAYQVTAGQGAKQQALPELILLEPEREITLPPGGKAQKVRFVGAATAAEPGGRDDEAGELRRVRVCRRRGDDSSG